MRLRWALAGVLDITADEAEYVVPLISDWLELDAADEWVRHDAEIVSARSLARSLALALRSPQRGGGAPPSPRPDPDAPPPPFRPCSRRSRSRRT